MNTILLKQFPEGLNPDVGVLSTFTHPNWDIPLVAEVNVLLDVLLGGINPIFVECINEVVGKWLSKPVEL